MRNTDPKRDPAGLRSASPSRFARDERGATAIEYAIMVALIGLAVVVSARLIGTEVAAMFTAISAGLTG